MRTVYWDDDDNSVCMIDQRLLPGDLVIAKFYNHQEVADAIRDMVVRGAPAIGAAAAFGLAVAGKNSNASDREVFFTDLQAAGEILRAARPTAVNLTWAVQLILSAVEAADGSVDDLRLAALNEAKQLADEDVEINKRMARHGAALINDGDTLIHHCNTGALATVDWGTALGVIRMAHEDGKNIHVLVDETRPRLQGARLTAWELERYGVPFDLISDNAAGYFLKSGQVNGVFVGSDRTAANGDVANKIGTYMLALAAFDNGVPFYPVVPTSTIDLSLANGGLIPIEERGGEEVTRLQINGKRVAPEGVSARNPAFDVTPNRLVTGIVTENGVARPPFAESLSALVTISRP